MPSDGCLISWNGRELGRTRGCGPVLLPCCCCCSAKVHSSDMGFILRTRSLCTFALLYRVRVPTVPTAATTCLSRRGTGTHSKRAGSIPAFSPGPFSPPSSFLCSEMSLRSWSWSWSLSRRPKIRGERGFGRWERRSSPCDADSLLPCCQILSPGERPEA